MTIAATITRKPTYGGVLTLSFANVEEALQAMRIGDTIILSTTEASK